MLSYSTELIVQDTTYTAVEFGFDENNQRITSENISLTVSGKVHASVDETVSTRWYFNGGTLRPGTTIGPLQRPLLSIFQTMEIKNASNLDFGFYDVVLTVDTHAHLLSYLECPSQYYSFVASTLGIRDIVLARDVIQIAKSGKQVYNLPMGKHIIFTSGVYNPILAWDMIHLVQSGKTVGVWMEIECLSLKSLLLEVVVAHYVMLLINHIMDPTI